MSACQERATLAQAHSPWYRVRPVVLLVLWGNRDNQRATWGSPAGPRAERRGRRLLMVQGRLTELLGEG